MRARHYSTFPRLCWCCAPAPAGGSPTNVYYTRILQKSIPIQQPLAYFVVTHRHDSKLYNEDLTSCKNDALEYKYSSGFYTTLRVQDCTEYRSTFDTTHPTTTEYPLAGAEVISSPLLNRRKDPKTSSGSYF